MHPKDKNLDGIVCFGWAYGVFWEKEHGPLIESLSYRRSNVIDLALQFYDHYARECPEVSLANEGYCADWSRSKKWRWMKARGASVLKVRFLIDK